MADPRPTMIHIDTSAKITAFIAEFYGLESVKIRESHTLFGDLCLVGREAEDFFLAYSIDFAVDMSEFDFKRHFYINKSPIFCMRSAVRLTFCEALGGDLHRCAGITPITVADLISAAEQGRWSY